MRILFKLGQIREMLVSIYNVLSRLQLVLKDIDSNVKDSDTTILGKYLKPIIPAVTGAIESVLDAMYRLAGWLRVQDRLSAVHTLSGHLTTQELLAGLESETENLKKKVKESTD